MILRTYLGEDDGFITVEYKEGEDLPEDGDILYPEGGDDDGIMVGCIIYDKYNVRTYKIIERGLEGSYYDL